LIRNNESFEGCVVHIWFSDERYVSSGSDERNDKGLIEGFSLSTAHCVFHVVDSAGSDPEQELDGAAANYARDMELEVGSKPFDSVVLSMGEDGHIASLFPGHIDASEPRFAIGISGSPKPPALRVSISLSRLAHANAIYIFGLGEGKIGALEAVQSGPVGLLAANSKNAQVTIMTDQLISGVKQ
jgi:6-phosphogluconolactonase